MISLPSIKNIGFLVLSTTILMAWVLLPSTQQKPENFTSEKVNLALRRTADKLLLQSGDSTSRIPPVEQIRNDVWKIHLEQSFDYAQLPQLLQKSLDLYDIRRPYQVAVRGCKDAIIDLGFHQRDLEKDSTVPCQEREMLEGCYNIEVTFLKREESSFWSYKTGLLFLLLGGIAVWWFTQRRQIAVISAPEPTDETAYVSFGNSRLDTKGQILHCNGSTQNLTYREAKLLQLFAIQPDQLLERDTIINQVWADEGVLVGRSVDVFVSRLRKKIAADTSIAIVAVHGVGYRLETGKNVEV